LAHASHWNTEKSLFLNFKNRDRKVKESWASRVQWELTRMIYPGYSPPYFVDDTGVAQDLIDGKSGYDQVACHTIK